MTTLGQRLRSEREDRGWTIDFVSFRSKIQPIIIEQLEAGDYSSFSSAPYVRSFLRKYSELLELEELEEEIDQIEVQGYSILDDPAGRESVKENLEMTEFSTKSERFRKAEKSKGSPVFLVGSVVVLLSGLAMFYYLGSRANLPVDAGTRSIAEEFDSKSSSFSRDNDPQEHLVRKKLKMSPIEAPNSVPKPLANTNEVLVKAIPVQEDPAGGIVKPDLNGFSPLSDLDEDISTGDEPLVRARTGSDFNLDSRGYNARPKRVQSGTQEGTTALDPTGF